MIITVGAVRGGKLGVSGNFGGGNSGDSSRNVFSNQDKTISIVFTNWLGGFWDPM